MLRLQKNWQSQSRWLGGILLAVGVAFGCGNDDASDTSPGQDDAGVETKPSRPQTGGEDHSSNADGDTSSERSSDSQQNSSEGRDTSSENGNSADDDAHSQNPNRPDETTSTTGGSDPSDGTSHASGSDSSSGDSASHSDTSGDTSQSTPPPSGSDSPRPPLLDLIGDHFAFGYSSYSNTRGWGDEVRESHDIDWRFMYWYHLDIADETVLPARLAEAKASNVIPILTHYQLLDRGKLAGYEGANEWDVVTQAVQDPDVMRGYFDNVQYLMEEIARLGGPVIFQTEPDSTTWLRQYHTGETWDARDGMVAVAASGHPDLSDLDDTIAGYAQALVRLRDRYAPKDVYMGLCEFDNENGYNPDRSVKYIQSLGAKFDVLFTHHVVKYSERGEGWWDAYSETAQQRFLTWIKTITEGTGLPYIHWQTVIGSADYGLMPDYPEQERISDLVEAGSVANLFDVYRREGPPHSQPWHGYSSSPPPSHPAYNSLEKLAERLERYYKAPIPLKK